MEQQQPQEAAGTTNSSAETRRPQEQEHVEKSQFQKVVDKFSPGVRITLLISLIFYIAMFIIGIWGVRKCPINDNIPFFLIVTGGIGLISKSSSIIRESLLKHKAGQYVESSFYTIEMVFLLLGSYWVFKVYKPSYDPHHLDYCSKTVYMFAFIYLSVLYSILFIIGLCFCCFLACIFFVKKTEDNNEDVESPRSPINPQAAS